MTKCRVLCFVPLLILASVLVHAQEQMAFRNQEVWVSDLAFRAAHSADSTAILESALETILHDPDVCCGKNSALEDDVLSSTRLSLKQLGSKLQGTHVLSDGRRIVIRQEYMPAMPTDAGETVGTRIIASLMRNQPLLMDWNSHLYIVQGALFDEAVDTNGIHDYAIHKLMLLDPRFSDDRKDTSFDRLKDNWNSVEGMLVLTVAQGS